MTLYQVLMKFSFFVTNLSTFQINTGDSLPVSKKPYGYLLLYWKSHRMVGAERHNCAKCQLLVFAFAPKPNRAVRLCVDYKITVPLAFFMPSIEECIDTVGDACYILTLELSKGIHQVLVDQDSQGKTSFICYRGKFRFTQMPFGIRNAPRSFKFW